MFRKPKNGLPLIILLFFIEKGTNIADLNNKIDSYMKEVSRKEKDLSELIILLCILKPLTRIHLHSNRTALFKYAVCVYICSYHIAILILMIACINYSTLQSRRSQKKDRNRNQKIVGSGKTQYFCNLSEKPEFL